MIQYTDHLGNPIGANDVVLYVTRVGSAINVCTGRVVAINDLIEHEKGYFVQRKDRMKPHPTVYTIPFKDLTTYEPDYSKAYTLEVEKLTEDGKQVSGKARIQRVERVVVITSLL